jgi:hypothetical protein
LNERKVSRKRTSDEIVLCLNYFEAILKANEAYYYQRKYFLPHFLERTKLYIKYPQVVLDNTISSNIHRNIHLALDSALEIPLNDLRALDNFSDNLDQTLPILLKILDTISATIVSIM